MRNRETEKIVEEKEKRMANQFSSGWIHFSPVRISIHIYYQRPKIVTASSWLNDRMKPGEVQGRIVIDEISVRCICDEITKTNRRVSPAYLHQFVKSIRSSSLSKSPPRWPELSSEKGGTKSIRSATNLMWKSTSRSCPNRGTQRRRMFVDRRKM